jgi:glutamine synthetase
MAKDSIAREVFGDDFVEHFGGTREHEVRLFDEAVTDWYVQNFFEGMNVTNCVQGNEAIY